MSNAEWRVPRCLAEAGFVEADPDPLMRWAQTAIETHDRAVGVVVAADGHLVAFTRSQGPRRTLGESFFGARTRCCR